MLCFNQHIKAAHKHWCGINYLLFPTHYSLTGDLSFSKHWTNALCTCVLLQARPILFPLPNEMPAFWKKSYYSAVKPGVQSYLRLPFALTGPPGVFIWAPFCRLGNQNICWKVTCSIHYQPAEIQAQGILHKCAQQYHIQPDALKDINLTNAWLLCKHPNKWGSGFKKGEVL